MENFNFKPKIIKEFTNNDGTKSKKYGVMLVELTPCKICDKDMIIAPNENRNSFVCFSEFNFNAQINKAGWVKQSYVLVDDKPICEECQKNNLADFLCALCNERKLINKIQDRYGDPAEFLCKDCYENKSAKMYEDKVEELSKRHRWDFE